MPECDLHASVRGGVERGADARATARAAVCARPRPGNVGGETTARVVAPAPARRLERLDGVHSVAHAAASAWKSGAPGPRPSRRHAPCGKRTGVGNAESLTSSRKYEPSTHTIASSPAAPPPASSAARRRAGHVGAARAADHDGSDASYRRRAPRSSSRSARRLTSSPSRSLERFERRRRPSGGAHAPRRGEPLELTGVEAAALVGRVRLPQHAESRAAAVEGEEAQMRHGTTADVDGV